MELFYKTLKKLSRNGHRAVIAIAGNHDSPDRIEAPDPLARECGIVLLGYPNSRVAPFQLESGLAVVQSDEGFIELKLPTASSPLRVLATPYANEMRLKTCLGFEDSETELRLLLQQKWQHLADTYCDKKGVNLLVTHLFMVRKGEPLPEEPEDEKPILHVGGAQAIYSENVPAQIQYVALGHLHSMRKVAESPCPMLYSSSPLAYGISEAQQQKYVVIVEAEPGKPVQVKEIKLHAGKKLFRKTFHSVDSAVEWLKEHPDSLVELTMVTNSYLTAEERHRLTEAHGGIISVIPMVTGEVAGQAGIKNEINLDKTMEELFKEYFQHKFNHLPNEEIMSLFKEVLAVESESGNGSGEE